jgi:hypothetical protein
LQYPRQLKQYNPNNTRPEASRYFRKKEGIFVTLMSLQHTVRTRDLCRGKLNFRSHTNLKVYWKNENAVPTTIL